MIIDGYTIIFQIINFMILVFLLRRFLYGPVVRAMEAREEKIIRREDEALAGKKEAEIARHSYREKKDELDQKEEEILEKVRVEAGKEKQEMMEEARREVDETRRRWQEALMREKESFIGELRRRIVHQACLTARGCLQDLADRDLEGLVLEHFLKKLARLPAGEAESLSNALSGSDKKAVLKAAFEIPGSYIQRLQEGLQEYFPRESGPLEIDTVEAKDLVCGLELETGGYRVAWSVDSYLQEIEENVLEELERVAGGEESEKTRQVEDPGKEPGGSQNKGEASNAAKRSHGKAGGEVSGDERGQ